MNTRIKYILIGIMMIFVIVACGSNTSNSVSTLSTPTHTATKTSSTVFKVARVDLTVNPSNISQLPCNSAILLTYAATFYIPAYTPGGVIQFSYTLTNGRSSTPVHINVNKNFTKVIYTFISKGILLLDHTYPGVAEVLVKSPNVLHSQQVKPSGVCK